MEDAALVVNGVLVALGFAVVLSLRSATVRRGWIVLLRWVWAHVQPPEEVDPLVAELYAANRRARLRRDLERVRRLVATDSWMSATRQLGNRFACRRLEADLRLAVEEEALDETRWTGAGTGWAVAAPATPGQVEILDIRLGGRSPTTADSMLRMAG